MDMTGGLAENDIVLEGNDKVSETDIEVCGNLLKGTYTMASYADEVMIRKRIKKSSYDLLSNFHHDSALHMISFYHDKDKVECIVIPKVDSSFLEWARAHGKSSLFTHERKLTVLFRNMIIELCELIDSLGKSSKCLEGLPMEDFYIKETSNGPKLLVLLTQVKWSKDLKNGGKRSMTFVKSFIDWCCNEFNVELDSLARSFADYIISQNFTVEMLKTYPDNWDYEIKGEYLLCVTSAGNSFKKAIVKSKITWPVELPDVLQRIINHDKNSGFEYKPKKDDHYIRVLRNAYKHFDELPDSIKAEFGSRDGFLKKIEIWTPNIWALLYDFTGFPCTGHYQD